MSRSNIGVGLGLLVALASFGCSASHQLAGDAGPREDAQVVGMVGPPCVPVLVPAGGFSPSETFVETYTPACGEPPFEGIPSRPPIGVCVVSGLDGDPRPGCTDDCASREQIERHTFCTCRCGGNPGTGPFCACPGGSRCVRLVEHGGRSGGSFCVPDRIVTP